MTSRIDRDDSEPIAKKIGYSRPGRATEPVGVMKKGNRAVAAPIENCDFRLSIRKDNLLPRDFFQHDPDG